MKTKYIFNLLALAMLMPAMLLTTACSNEDDVVNNTENIANKGYELPVTVNVTRQDAAATRATYTDNGGGTGSFSFSKDDKLFVKGKDESEGGVGYFAGTLTWQSGGTFSGTILTENKYSGTIDDLFKAGSALATLLPAKYGDYPYLSFTNKDTYSASVNYDVTKTFATSKATAVEQFSFEVGGYTSGTGFALHPSNAILNFTITGLAASTGVNVALSDGGSLTISGNVTTNDLGTATFAIGVNKKTDIKDWTLTVAGNPITLVSSSKVVAAGKIYNITRAITDLSTINANYTASNGVTLTGTLGANKQISIADGATVILNNVNINGSGTWTSGNYAGITCEGDATIILSGTNNVKGFYEKYPGIYVPSGKKLTIQGVSDGNGKLTASSNGYAAGIGAGYALSCGDIEIQGGDITATGGYASAGIGSGNGSACGTITISGGTVTATGGSSGAGIGSGNAFATCGAITISGGTVEATGGQYGAGIGSGFESACGTINIASTVIKVTATKGTDAPDSIGKGGGQSSSCGTVTIEDPSKVTQN